MCHNARDAAQALSQPEPAATVTDLNLDPLLEPPPFSLPIPPWSWGTEAGHGPPSQSPHGEEQCRGQFLRAVFTEGLPSPKQWQLFPDTPFCHQIPKEDGPVSTHFTESRN